MPTTPQGPRVRVAAAIVEAGEVLLVRHEKAGNSYWMLPGGGVGYGETVADALIRELREEVCVDIRVGPLLLGNDSIAPDGHRHIINMYFHAEITGGHPALGIDDRIVEVAFHPVSTLSGLNLRPDIAPALVAVLQEGGQSGATYLGNVWRD